MIALFIKSGRGWFWELLLWLLIVELPRAIQLSVSYRARPSMTHKDRPGA